MYIGGGVLALIRDHPAPRLALLDRGPHAPGSGERLLERHARPAPILGNVDGGHERADQPEPKPSPRGLDLGLPAAGVLHDDADRGADERRLHVHEGRLRVPRARWRSRTPPRPRARSPRPRRARPARPRATRAARRAGCRASGVVADAKLERSRRDGERAQGEDRDVVVALLPPTIASRTCSTRRSGSRGPAATVARSFARPTSIDSPRRSTSPSV